MRIHAVRAQALLRQASLVASTLREARIALLLLVVALQAQRLSLQVLPLLLRHTPLAMAVQAQSLSHQVLLPLSMRRGSLAMAVQSQCLILQIR